MVAGFTDNRPRTGLPDHQRYRPMEENLDDLDPDRKRLRTGRCLVAFTVLGRVFDKNILNRGAGASFSTT
jgi:hypothetical protein